MFGRATSPRGRRSASERKAAARDQEIQQLRAHVARLENALASAIASAGDTVIDLERQEAAFARERAESTPTPGFAAEWSDFEPTPEHQADGGFFSVAETDQRARQWLLS